MSLILLRYGRPNAPDMESMDSELPPEPFRLPPCCAVDPPCSPPTSLSTARRRKSCTAIFARPGAASHCRHHTAGGEQCVRALRSSIAIVGRIKDEDTLHIARTDERFGMSQCTNRVVIARSPVLPSTLAKIRSLLNCLHIAGPITAPAPAATAILCFIFSWNDFFYALILARTAGDRPVAIVNFIQFEGWE